MYKSVNWQTKEVKTGSFEDLCDLDKRVWNLEEVKTKSHNLHKELPVIGTMLSIAVTPTSAHLGLDNTPWYHPVTYHDIMKGTEICTDR